MANTSRKSEAIPVKHGSESGRINPDPDLKMAYLSLHCRKWSARNAAASRSDTSFNWKYALYPCSFVDQTWPTFDTNSTAVHGLTASTGLYCPYQNYRAR
jgi:hypothetical protein